MVRDKVFASLSIEPSPVGPFNTLYSWGNNTWGAVGDGTSINKIDPQQVGSGTDWAQLSAGSGYCLAVKTDGTLWAWGSNGSFQLGTTGGARSSPVQIGALSDWSQVSAGSGDSSLAVKTDGTLWAWGSGSFGGLGDGTVVAKSSPVQIGALSDWSQIANGANSSLAVKTDGTLWAWGAGTSGQLGDGTIVNKSSPVQIGALSDWAQVSAGIAYSIAIKTNSTIWGWGANTNRQLGDNTVISKSSPVQVGNLTSDWAQVSAGSYANSHSLAIKTNGTLWAWGQNSNGQLGDPTALASVLTPIQIGALSDWAQVSASAISSAAVKTNGTLWTWGTNQYGQLGIGGNFLNRSSPVQVGALSDWAQVSGGAVVSGNLGFYVARRTGNTLYSWGEGSVGQLGLNQGNYFSPVQIGSAEWDQVSYGVSFTVAIKTDNSLWAWGLGEVGQLGNNLVAGAASTPNQIGALTDWAQVTAGGATNNQFCLAVKTNGTLWSWGFNSSGQLGDGTVVAKSSPVQIGALSDWAQVAASITTNHSVAIKTNGTLWAWGLNTNGELGDGTVVAKSSPVQIGALSDWAQVSAGSNFSAAIKTNNTLWAWGFNSSGQLGQNNTVSRSSPVQIGALSDWAQVSAGGPFLTAIKTNGTLWALGSAGQGSLGDGTTVSKSSPVQIGASSNWAEVTSGSACSIAVKTNGTLWAWGSGANGLLGQNSTTNRSSPVQIGSLSVWGQTPVTVSVSNSGALSS